MGPIRLLASQPWPFMVTWHRRSRDHSILHSSFPVCFFRQFFVKTYRLTTTHYDVHTLQTDWIGLSSVLRPHQNSIGYMGDGFYRSKDPTNSIKVLKEQRYRWQTDGHNTVAYTWPLVRSAKTSYRYHLPGTSRKCLKLRILHLSRFCGIHYWILMLTVNSAPASTVSLTDR